MLWIREGDKNREGSPVIVGWCDVVWHWPPPFGLPSPSMFWEDNTWMATTRIENSKMTLFLFIKFVYVCTWIAKRRWPMPDIFPVYAFLSYLCARSAPDDSVLRIVFYCFAVLSGVAYLFNVVLRLWLVVSTWMFVTSSKTEYTHRHQSPNPSQKAQRSSLNRWAIPNSATASKQGNSN